MKKLILLFFGVIIGIGCMVSHERSYTRVYKFEQIGTNDPIITNYTIISNITRTKI